MARDGHEIAKPLCVPANKGRGLASHPYSPSALTPLRNQDLCIHVCFEVSRPGCACGVQARVQGTRVGTKSRRKKRDRPVSVLRNHYVRRARRQPQARAFTQCGEYGAVLCHHRGLRPRCVCATWCGKGAPKFVMGCVGGMLWPCMPTCGGFSPHRAPTLPTGLGGYHHPLARHTCRTHHADSPQSRCRQYGVSVPPACPCVRLWSNSTARPCEKPITTCVCGKPHRPHSSVAHCLHRAALLACLAVMRFSRLGRGLCGCVCACGGVPRFCWPLPTR